MTGWYLMLGRALVNTFWPEGAGAEQAVDANAMAQHLPKATYVLLYVVGGATLNGLSTSWHLLGFSSLFQRVPSLVTAYHQMFCTPAVSIRCQRIQRQSVPLY